MKNLGKQRLVLLILILLVFTGCGKDTDKTTGNDDSVADVGSLYPESALKGWHIDETNTGLKGDYTGLEALNASDVGYIAYGSLYITIPGVTISRKLIEYPVIIQAGGVTIEYCLIRPTAGGNGVPVVQAADATVRDTEINLLLTPPNIAGGCITIVGENCIIERCNIRGGACGISIHNTSATKISVAQDNYVHELQCYTDPQGNVAHVDGLTIRDSSGKGIIVRNNNIQVGTSIATGPLFIQALQGHINNVLIEGNLLKGYGTALALDYNANGYGNNMSAVDNRLYSEPGWITGISGGPGWNEWSENYLYDAANEDCKGGTVSEPVP